MKTGCATGVRRPPHTQTAHNERRGKYVRDKRWRQSSRAEHSMGSVGKSRQPGITRRIHGCFKRSGSHTSTRPLPAVRQKRRVHSNALTPSWLLFLLFFPPLPLVSAQRQSQSCYRSATKCPSVRSKTCTVDGVRRTYKNITSGIHYSFPFSDVWPLLVKKKIQTTQRPTVRASTAKEALAAPKVAQLRPRKTAALPAAHR